MGCILVCACVLLQAVSIQTDWSGGPGVAGPVDSFGVAFHCSDSVAYSSSGLIVPFTKMGGQGIITDWTKHVIETRSGIDGHGGLRPADFDGDGDFDLAGAIDGLDRIRLYRNKLIPENSGDSVTFEMQTDLSCIVKPRCGIWVGDLNDDGRPDIVVPGDSMFWFRNDGNWVFTKLQFGRTYEPTYLYCEAGDVDNDGDMDVVFGISPLILFRNNGDMTFARESIAVGKRWRLSLADLNNDGYLDILNADDVYLNGGDASPGVFPHTPSWTAGYTNGWVDGIGIADFDGDNDRDLLICTQWATSPDVPAMYWYENDGTGLSFTQHVIFKQGSSAKDYGDAAIAQDMDLDGRNDAVGAYSKVGYFHQNENPDPDTFFEVVVDPNFGGSGGCHWVEVENLGKRPGGIKFTKDIMGSGYGEFAWWENGLDTSYSTNGWLVSSVLDAGEPSVWERFGWDASRPESTQLYFFLRTGVTVAACTLASWQGPIPASQGGRDTASIAIDTLTTPGDRYFQYRVLMIGDTLGISSNAPWVEEVWVSYTQRHDVGAEAILVPGDTVSQHQQVTPRVVVRNYGTSVETFPVTMRIGSDYNETVNDVTLAPGQVDTVVFSAKWTAGTVGDFPTRAYTRLAVDDDRSNDTVYGLVTVNVPIHDAGAYEILAPVGLLESGTVITPRVMVRNYGSSEEVFPVTLRIGSAYSRTVSGIRLSGGEEAMVTFPNWTAAPIGRYPVQAFTHMYNDDNRSNDSVMDTTIVYVDRHDVGPTGIRVPARKVLVESEIWPSVVVQNFGGYVETFDLEVTIENEERAVVFQGQEQVAGLELGETRLYTFTEHSWTASPVGNYRVWAVTRLVGDENTTNDEFGPEGVMVRDIPPWPGGWAEVETMPSAPSSKPVKRGGWLTSGPDATIFAAKGNKTSDFYVFDPVANTWTLRAEIEAGIEGKLPDKGCRGAWDGGDHVYMTKGANTFGFHCYHIAADSWSRLPDVPEGPGRKKVKGGTDMVYVVRDDTGWVYLLKGYKTEFYRFNTAAGRWDTLPDAPGWTKPKWDKGSWLVYDEANAIYAHQARYFNRTTNHHYMFRYDITGDSWETEALTGMPLLGFHSGRLRKKKAKDGSAGAWDCGAISAIKGGNTQQFFTYNPETDSWIELDTIPGIGTTGRKKYVKHGADLVAYGNGVFFALKGNKTREMWRYCFAGAVGPRPHRGSAAMAGPAGLREPGLQVKPNPVADGFATVRYSVPLAGPARLSVYDAGGRRVADLALHVERDGAVGLDLRDLPAGSYLARLDAGGWCTSHRFVLY